MSSTNPDISDAVKLLYLTDENALQSLQQQHRIFAALLHVDRVGGDIISSSQPTPLEEISVKREVIVKALERTIQLSARGVIELKRRLITGRRLQMSSQVVTTVSSSAIVASFAKVPPWSITCAAFALAGSLLAILFQSTTVLGGSGPHAMFASFTSLTSLNFRADQTLTEIRALPVTSNTLPLMISDGNDISREIIEACAKVGVVNVAPIRN